MDEVIQVSPGRFRRLNSGPCRHQGRPTGEHRDCRTCGGAPHVPLLACRRPEIGTCTGDRLVPGLTWCRTCPHHEPADTLQVIVDADGIGDAILGLSVTEALRRRWRGKMIAYVVKAWQRPWVELFDGYDHLSTTPLPGVAEFHPHATYPAQMAQRTQGGRVGYYARACGEGVSPTLPAARPLWPKAVEWAEPYRGAIVLSPWSAYQNRTWLLPGWLQLERLLLDRDRRVVVLGGAGEFRVVPFRGEKVCGESPARVAALMSVAGCVVGNDSGMVHLAGMLRRPTIALCGPIAGAKVFGLYPSVRVIDGPLRCSDCHWSGRDYRSGVCDVLCASLAAIEPGHVLAAVEAVMRSTAG
jgi:ADP-heptose:LPS heptosyltransferase